MRFLENLSPTPAAYRAALQQLRAAEVGQLRSLRVAVAASFRAEPLADYLVVEGARRGFLLEPWFAPYGQFELECASPKSALFAGKPDIVILALQLEDLAGEVERVERMAANVRRWSTASVVTFNFAEDVVANQRIEQWAARNPGVVVFDFARLALEIGLNQLYDLRLEYVSRMPFSTAGQIAIAKRLARLIRALYVPPAKCLVVDLDNTLWGGILGEAGPAGIALGQDYPGRVFQDFQRALGRLRERGILLAIASKNNVTEVLQVFEQHPDMVLRWQDFAATEIHWNDKASSLRAIARELRIGLDALVFYDDNPLERSWIRSELPEVTVIEVPEDLLGRMAALESCEAFDQVQVSEEDRQRATLYQRERRREQARSESGSLAEFLAGLEIQVTVGLVDGDTLPRVAQLISKTNQFNLTGRRLTEAELRGQIEGGAMACWLRAADRFGDYGLVAAAVAVPEGADWRVDNFVVSCRILGRQVENALLAMLARQVAAAGGKRLIGEYIATPRNVPARDFYVVLGFQAEGDRWVWDLAGGIPAVPAHLTVGPTPTVGSFHTV